MSRHLSIGSLFSGIGGLELGLEWAGLGPVSWQVERESFAQSILAKHWPSAARFADVRDCGAHNLAPVDLICGGFPCQDVSLAGKGEGLAGKRSGLWREYARIVGELRPRIVVVENVSALRSRGLGQVLGDLATLGYDAWWDCIPAATVGAPHRRDRLFIVAYAQRDGLSRPIHPQPRQGAINQSRRSTDPSSAQHLRTPEPLMGRAAHGLPRWVDRGWPAGPSEAQHPWEAPRTAQGVLRRPARLKALGNAVVPQVGYVIGQAIREVLHA